MVRPVDAVIKELKQLHNHCTIHLRFTAELAKRATVKNEADSALRHPVLLLTDRVRAGQLHIEYCLTSDIWAGIHTKPLQGTTFHKFRKLILNLT